MREMLEPIFGETGAVVAQFVITLVIVLLLVVVVVWLVRRYSQGGLAGGGRGRLPRLAIVDAMAVDSRRKLVLVRRDNVEHLILIGGPSDLVVEPGIMRQRSAAGQRQAAAQQAAAAAPPVAPAEAPPEVARPRPSSAAPPAPPPPPPPPPAIARAKPEPVGSDQPIPFPPRRAPSAGRFSLRRDSTRKAAAEEPQPEEPRPVRSAPAQAPSPPAVDEEAAIAPRRATASARCEETSRPTRVQPSFSLVSEPEAELPPPLDLDDRELAAAPALSEAPEETAAEYVVPEPEASESVLPAELHAAVPAAGPETGEGAEPSVKVADLEKEMARLLGEISTSRSS
jgi:flagellar protein FliO/FliZ